MRFFSRPGPQAEQRSGADQPVGVGWSAPLLWVLEGWGHGRRNADCGHTTTKPGVSKGGHGLPFGTRPCLQGVVCYTCWRGCRCKRGAVRYAPRLHRQENGLGFCDREGTKSLSVFRERRQVYKPSSLVPRPPQGWDKVSRRRRLPFSQNPKGAGKHPWGLPALITVQQDRAGQSMAAHVCAVHLDH